MAIDISPPEDDEEVSRHKFYTAISAALENFTTAVNNMGASLETITQRHEEVASQFAELRTSIKTVLKTIYIIGMLLGSIVTFAFQQTYQYSQRIEALERKVELHLVQYKALELLPEVVLALKNRQNMQDEKISSLERDRDRGGK